MTKFIRHRAHTKKRLGDAWRRPRGFHNKMRLSKKGHRPKVRIGYGTDASLRNTRKGLKIVTVYNVADVAALDAKTQGAVVGAVGAKKKIEILKAIQEHKVTLLTGDAAAKQKELEQAFAQRKKITQERDQEREKKQQVLKQKAAEQEKQEAAEKAEPEAEAEEHKKEEDKDKEKVLTKAR